MKKVFASSLILLIMASAAAAAAGPVKLGVKAGLSRAGQTWEYSNSLGTVERGDRSGPAFGVFTDVPMMPVLTLRLDALYVRKGSQITVMETTEAYPEGTGRYLTIKDHIDYLSLALTGKTNLVSGPTGLFLTAGPRIDIKVGENFAYPLQFSESLYKSTVFGLVLGGGVEASVGPTATVLVEFRYDLDLSDAGEYTTTESDLTVKNDGFQVLAGVRF